MRARRLFRGWVPIGKSFGSRTILKAASVWATAETSPRLCSGATDAERARCSRSARDSCARITAWSCSMAAPPAGSPSLHREASSISPIAISFPGALRCGADPAPWSGASRDPGPPRRCWSSFAASAACWTGRARPAFGRGAEASRVGRGVDTARRAACSRMSRSPASTPRMPRWPRRHSGLARQGCAIVITGHEVRQLLNTADDIVWMAAGTTRHGNAGGGGAPGSSAGNTWARFASAYAAEPLHLVDGRAKGGIPCFLFPAPQSPRVPVPLSSSLLSSPAVHFLHPRPPVTDAW